MWSWELGLNDDRVGGSGQVAGARVALGVVGRGGPRVRRLQDGAERGRGLRAEGGALGVGLGRGVDGPDHAAAD
eukprot:1729767-Prymnesium_polylepis.1